MHLILFLRTNCNASNKRDHFSFHIWLISRPPPIVLWCAPETNGRTSPRIAIPANNNSQIKPVEKHAKRLGFLCFHPKVEIGAVVTDIDIIRGIVHSIAIIGKTGVDDFKSRWQNLRKATFSTGSLRWFLTVTSATNSVPLINFRTLITAPFRSLKTTLAARLL